MKADVHHSSGPIRLKMNKIRSLFLLIAVTVMVSCSSNNGDVYYSKDTNAFDILIGQYAHNIEQIWGRNEILIAGPKDYVQYSDGLQSRVHIDFVAGKITIETLSHDPAPILKSEIISTLLMSEPVDIIKNDASERNLAAEPFLFGQVVDQHGEAIRWQGRAGGFADYLIANQMKVRFSGGHQITYIEINLVPNHVDQRARKFMPLITEASNRYRVDERLILSIMEVESSFNPFAVSRTDALGLMQVQQHTAGRDIYKSWGLGGEPARSYLLDPKNNIMMGTAYLALVRDSYLAGIKNPLSLKYALITSYNGGAGSVLRTFSSDRVQAVDIINDMTPQQVYQKLTTQHPAQESRNYLVKVNRLLTRH